MRATAIAHPNIALVKYWGKRDSVRNLPAAGSISLTLGPLHTRTEVAFTGAQGPDRVELDGEEAEPGAARRVTAVLDLLRHGRPDLGAAHVRSRNDFPTAAGLASSSSGFAALVVAADAAASLGLSPSALSILARRGSGSAARSIFGGFVRMESGVRDDGEDAFARPLAPADHWPLSVCIALTTEGAKKVPSTRGMDHTAQTSPYHHAWIADVDRMLPEAEAIIAARDFDGLARLAEASALRMHASALAADPGVLYWNGATVECMHAVRHLRSQGCPAFFTIDAGPHVKVFCAPASTAAVEEALRCVPGVRDVLHATPAGDARALGTEDR
ncbi:MAG: diphosphomevalonate decarboxylase [Deltaproteobacteria bacterium]|nr:MAG: diphosphomevalonate decarboxylase [Deltaproteobacteria bacterium]